MNPEEGSRYEPEDSDDPIAPEWQDYVAWREGLTHEDILRIDMEGIWPDDTPDEYITITQRLTHGEWKVRRIVGFWSYEGVLNRTPEETARKQAVEDQDEELRRLAPNIDFEEGIHQSFKEAELNDEERLIVTKISLTPSEGAGEYEAKITRLAEELKCTPDELVARLREILVRLGKRREDDGSDFYTIKF